MSYLSLVMANNHGAHVIGVGAYTPVGITAPSAAAAVRAGISAFTAHPFVVDTAGNRMIVALSPYLAEDLDIEERLVRLALPAVREASSVVKDIKDKIPLLPMILGLPSPRPGLPESYAARVTERIVAGCDTFQLSASATLVAGHSAGLLAFEAGYRKIEEGTTDFCLVGAVDSYVVPETLEWLEECDQVHSAGPLNNAWGFVPGEAAGFCLLVSQKMTQTYGLRSLAKPIAAVSAFEKNLIKTDAVCLGEGLTAAFKGALRAVPDANAKIDHVICDMNGEPYRADEYGFTSTRVSERFTDIADFVAPADCWGDVGAASGPLFVNLAQAAWQKGYARGPYALLCTSSEGGERSVLILSDTQGVNG